MRYPVSQSCISHCVSKCGNFSCVAQFCTFPTRLVLISYTPLPLCTLPRTTLMTRRSRASSGSSRSGPGSGALPERTVPLSCPSSWSQTASTVSIIFVSFHLSIASFSPQSQPSLLIRPPYLPAQPFASPPTSICQIQSLPVHPFSRGTTSTLPPPAAIPFFPSLQGAGYPTLKPSKSGTT